MVRALSNTTRFSALPVAERAEALLDPGALEAQSSAGSLWLARGRLALRPVLLAVTDRTRAGGALGAAESGALRNLLSQACRDGQAVVLLLESAGAKLDEGLSALGAFRRLFAAALEARLAGVPMAAVITGDCFGGASLLACACAQRFALAGARFGLSGPGIIQALGGVTELDASDRDAVQRLLGVSARHGARLFERICDDNGPALRTALSGLLAARPTIDLHAEHRRLRERLTKAGVAVHAPGDAWRAFGSGRAVGALECWLAADAVLDRPAEDLAITLDSPGQATTRLDEAVGLSQYVAHLALCLASFRAGGGRLRLRLGGEAAGAIYVALAAPADRVSASRSTLVRTLPPRAVAEVLRTPAAEESIEAALTAGVVDEIA